MSNEPFTLGEALPQELARCRELLSEYQAIGPADRFGYAAIRQAIERAEKAMIEGDTVAMVRCYQDLKECE